MQSLNDEGQNRRLDSVGGLRERGGDPVFRELSVVGDQYWCHVIVQTGGFASVDAPAPVAAERTPGQRSLNVGAVVAKLELPDCAELVEPDKEIEVLVGEPATVRLTRRLRRFTPRREGTGGISERVDGDSLRVSIARALDLLGATTISRNMRSALMP